MQPKLPYGFIWNFEEMYLLLCIGALKNNFQNINPKGMEEGYNFNEYILFLKN